MRRVLVSSSSNMLCSAQRGRKKRKHGRLPDHIVFSAAPWVTRPDRTRNITELMGCQTSVVSLHSYIICWIMCAGRDGVYRQYVAVWLPEVCEGCFFGARKCKHTRTRGRGHEMESSREDWYVLALVSTPYREGWGVCLWSPLGIHSSVDSTVRVLTKPAFMLHFSPVKIEMMTVVAVLINLPEITFGQNAN